MHGKLRIQEWMTGYDAVCMRAKRTAKKRTGRMRGCVGEGRGEVERMVRKNCYICGSGAAMI